jgi:NAD(P)-dependent dehydrogenase (short-subunit alcohol dehydrogenase family)
MTPRARKAAMLDLQGKIAVVTGASRGLGQCVARALAGRGAHVALVARTFDALRLAADDIERGGGTAVALAADTSKIEDVDRVATQVRGKLGPPQILVNAAGVFGPIQRVVDSDPRRWIETLAVNTIGPYLTCRAFAPAMIERGWGRIVNFSSAASLHTPGPLNSAYGTSKVALNQFTRHLAAELAGTGVTANVIHPGEVRTEMWATICRESQATGPAGQGFRAWAEHVGQTGGDDPQRAVELVLKLVDERSAGVNGQFLWIEGGMQTPIPSW